MVTKRTTTEGRQRQNVIKPAAPSRGDLGNLGLSIPNQGQDANKEAIQGGTRPLIKILLCDDDPVDSKLIRSYLQRMTDREIVLLEARGSEEIRDALDKRGIDLVLMDDQICRESRVNWLAEIAKRQLGPVVILTESRTEGIVTQHVQEGAVHCLPKGSLSVERLSTTIDLALDRWTQLQQARSGNQTGGGPAGFDWLTGLHNRQAVLDKLRDFIAVDSGYREDLSLIVLDIDHFEEINDRYGHLTGDEALARIGSTVRHNVRDSDIVGRWAGDQFIIIVPGTALSSAWVVAERLRTLVQRLEMKDPKGSAFSVTVSLGVVAWERGEDACSLIRRADEALYKAKQKGPNRVQILLGPSLVDRV